MLSTLIGLDWLADRFRYENTRSENGGIGLEWERPAGSSYSSSCLFSPGSKGTSKEGGAAGSNARGGNTPPALGDLFAGGFPVLRPAGQRDVSGKEVLNPVAWWSFFMWET
jgi:hypothetical protein